MFEAKRRFFSGVTIDGSAHKKYKVSPPVEEINAISQKLAEHLCDSFSSEEAMSCVMVSIIKNSLQGESSLGMACICV